MFWGAKTALTATTKAFGVGALTAIIHTRAGARSAFMSHLSCDGHLPRQELNKMKRTENDNKPIPATCAFQTYNFVSVV